MRRLTQPYYEKSMTEVEARMLTRILEKRFGVILPLLRPHVFSTNVGSVEAWVDRTLDAPDLCAVFDTNYDERTTPLDFGVFQEALIRADPDRAERHILFLILDRLLERRFGKVSHLILKRISAGDLEQRKTWLERACDAPDMEAVFEGE